MEDFFRKHASSVTVGIVSSVLFLYLFQPVLDYIGQSLLVFLSIISEKFSNDFYAKIAHLEAFDYSFFWVAVLLGTFAFGAGSISLVGLVKLAKKSEEAPKEREEYKEKSKIQKAIFYIINLSFCLFVLLFLSTTFYQLRLITSFKQHIRIVAPYISDQAEEEFLSRWSLMKSSNEYDAIYKDLENIASNNKVILPENNLYSVTSF